MTADAPGHSIHWPAYSSIPNGFVLVRTFVLVVYLPNASAGHSPFVFELREKGNNVKKREGTLISVVGPRVLI